MEIYSVITKMDKKSIEKLIAFLPMDEINIIKKPETGLLMMVAKDSFDTDFYLGEILVTEAEVEYTGKTGYAMMISGEPEKILLAASLDAILQSDNKDLKQRVMDFIAMQAEKITEQDELGKRLVAKTMVNFETMSKG